jgi:hypothetical protein
VPSACIADLPSAAPKQQNRVAPVSSFRRGLFLKEKVEQAAASLPDKFWL